MAWGCIGAAILAWTFGEIYYTGVLWTVETVPVPSPADAGYLLMPPLMLVGVLLLLRSRTRAVPLTLLADGLTAALAIAALSAAIVFQTALDAASGDPLGVATTLAYPLSDLVLGGFVIGALAGTGWRLDRTWALLGVGILTFWLADSLYLVQVANGVYESSSWFDAGWWIGPDAGGRGRLAAAGRRGGARGGHPADRDAAELRRGRPRAADLRLLRRAERPGGRRWRPRRCWR